MHLGKVTKIKNALLLLIVFVPGLLSSVFWIIAKNLHGRKGALLLTFALYLTVNLVLPIAGGIRYLTYAGDEGQIAGLVLAVLLFRVLEVFVVVSSGGVKAVWTGQRR